MEKTKLGFDDFINCVNDGSKEFITDLHQEFMNNGCKIEVKEAKSGHLVSYTLNKKTVANYVFRKAGIIARIYANHITDYMEFLETLPENMIKSIQDAPVCKRLINPEDCNPKCAKGYDFLMKGERYQKCRTNAFMFLLSKENNGFIKEFLIKEIKACS